MLLQMALMCSWQSGNLVHLHNAPLYQHMKFVTICLLFVFPFPNPLTTCPYHTDASVDSHLMSTEVCYPYICHTLPYSPFHDSIFTTGWNTVDSHLMSTEYIYYTCPSLKALVIVCTMIKSINLHERQIEERGHSVL